MTPLDFTTAIFDNSAARHKEMLGSFLMWDGLFPVIPDDDATLVAIKSGFTWNHAHADAGSFVLFHKETVD